MPVFSEQSLRRLNECDHHLIVFFNEVIKLRDCTILCGYRGPYEQNQAFKNGNSTVQWPNSKHNIKPETPAVDVAPYFAGKGISFNRYEVVEFGHYCLGIRDCMHLTDRIRWGGDWDRDFLTLTDNEFLDAFHWEII